MAEATQNRTEQQKPLLVITGAGGNLGPTLVDAFAADYTIVGLDRHADDEEANETFEIDITSPASVQQALDRIGREHGRRIAAVIHLVAYFDFSGEADARYRTVNVEGTRNLLRALRDFEVERFVYASTMLVHQPANPGGRIDESTPLAPGWEYPESKKHAEDAIRAEATMPYAILRLAGVYDTTGAVPTLTHQIARIYERRLQSHIYAGPTDAGQSMLHRDDMIDAFRRTLDRRSTLPERAEILIGEPEAIGYDDLQDKIGALIHGERDWPTIQVPAPIAKVGAWLQDKVEPVVPDAIDGGREPFVKPFMIDLAADHYALDIGRAEQWLGWRPRHRLADELPAMIADLRRDPKAWYERNGIEPPPRD